MFLIIFLNKIFFIFGNVFVQKKEYKIKILGRRICNNVQITKNALKIVFLQKNALKIVYLSIRIWGIDFRSVKWSGYIRISDNPNIRTSTLVHT